MSTIAVPSPVPPASDDAESIRKALQGNCCSSCMHSCCLMESGQGRPGGDPRAMILWTMDPAERDANLVHESLKKKQRDESHCISVLIEMLVRLVSSYRYEGDDEFVDMDVVRLEASQLAEAIRKKKQPNGDEVIRIVTTRSKSQLRATFQRYREDHGADITEDIDSHCSGQFARMLKNAVWCLTSPEKHFAEVIKHSILGLGTYEDMLTRVIVSRAEIDMKMIREEYRVRYKTTVTRDVVGDTSFGYKGFLLALVGRED
uniref:Annexin n=1 Tax=Leersia perrieri TaxID=77586 RepID=A0A0D9X2G5_9ORYZ